MIEPLVVIGNCVDELYIELETRLFHPKSAFKKLLIVPSKTVKDDLTKRFAESKKISMGFKVLALEQAFTYLLSFHLKNKNFSMIFPSIPMLSLIIQKEIHLLIAESLSFKHEKEIDSLKRYLFSNGEALDIQKTQGLSRTLAKEFSKIRIYGGVAVEDFLVKPTWQSILYSRVYQSHLQAAQILQSIETADVAMDIHLFIHPFIPKFYREFFSLLTNYHTVIDYIWSPTQMFVGDILSDKKRVHFEKKALDKGIKIEEVMELDRYLSDKHSIMANYSDVLRKRLQPLENERCFQVEKFKKNQNFKELKLLNIIQDSLVELDLSEIALKTVDDSIQIHSAPTRLREVQIVKQIIMRLIVEKGYRLSDFLILASDLSNYMHYFTHVLDDKEHSLAHTIYPLEMHTQDPFLRALWKLLDLYQRDFRLQDVIEFMHDEVVKKRWNWTEKEVFQCKIWSEKSGIDKGFDTKTAIDQEHTWDKGIRRLVLGMALFDSEQCQTGKTYCPLDLIDSSQLELFDKFVQFIHLLKQQMQCLEEREQKLSDWVLELRKLADLFFDSESNQGYSYLMKQLKELLKINENLGAFKFSFSTFKTLVRDIIFSLSASFEMREFEKITITHLSQTHLTAFPVVICVGMDENLFPTKDHNNWVCPIDLKRMDSHLNASEEDREAFLRVLGMSKDYVIFSFTHTSEEDGKKMMLSPFVEELDLFVKQSIHSNGILRREHAPYGFHKMYFQKDEMRSFSQIEFQITVHQNKTAEISSSHFLNSFYKSVQVTPHNRQGNLGSIQLRDLREFSKHPLRYYFNKTIGFPTIRKIHDEQETYRMPSWKIRKLAKRALLEESENILLKEKLLGRFPEGVFYEITFQDVKEEIGILKDRLFLNKLHQKDLFSIELTKNCQEIKRIDSRYVVAPAIRCEIDGGSEVYLEGVIEDVSPRGMVVFEKDDLKELLENVPVYFLFSQLDLDRIGVKNSLVFLKNEQEFTLGKAISKEYLRMYLDYYFEAKDTPSPLMPSWIKHYDSDLLAFSEKMQKDFSNDEYQDDIFKWCGMHFGTFAASALYHDWSGRAKLLLSMVKWKEPGEV